MLRECDHIVIPIQCKYGIVNLNIVPSTQKDKLYCEEVSSSDTSYQLVEGSMYQYEFNSDDGLIFQFSEESEIVRYSTFRNHRNMGEIFTGNYVGLLSLFVCNLTTKEQIGKVKLEIRSVKADYESDYRQMLDDIAEYYTDLVLTQGSSVKQLLEIDESCPSQTLYQKFSFIRSIIDSDSFQESIYKIMANPVRKWADAMVQSDIVSVRRLSRRNLRQIASAKDRVNLPATFRKDMPTCLTSIPRKLDVDYKRDTIDNQENQFIKYALVSFSMFCSDLREKKNASDRLRKEVDQTINHISNFLESQFFRHVSMPTHLNLNSPVLQRKEGYREVLQVWLLFDFAARLNWSGGDTVYEAGKKNVAVLYEYWLFFKLQELISEFFKLNPADKEKLVKYDDDKIDLNIVQGRTTILRGKSVSSLRTLNIAFYYNRTFSKIAPENDPVHKAGSWTMAMRPDYTLSIWPGEISETEAEAQELITHIHFDAKYRLNKILLDDAGEKDLANCLNQEKEQQELGVYKRADLLKMHAYKDAIRRTSGAYVLYPGTESRAIKGFHEIVPGLGAFSIRPGHWNNDSIHLRNFLSEVKAHMLDRTSDREKLSYHQYEVYKQENDSMLMESLPESVNDNRDFIPDEAYVIIAYYKTLDHLNWILNKHKYNLRLGLDNGGVSIDKELMNARYLLLHDGNKSTHFIKLLKKGPKILTRSQLIEIGYPMHTKKDNLHKEVVDTDREQQEANRIYLVFDLFQKNTVEKELQQYAWNMIRLLGKSRFNAKTMKLSDLVRKAEREEVSEGKYRKLSF